VTLLDLSPADFRPFLTVLVDRRLLGCSSKPLDVRWATTML
jgi:hypothetical protein